MGDAAKTLREQVEHWERVEAEAEEDLRVARAALPGLRESLRQVEGTSKEPSPAVVATTPPPAPSHIPTPTESPSEVESSQLDDDGSRSLVEVKRSEDVRAAIREAVAGLSDEFDQNTIKEALLAHGYLVNTSTLRGNLKTLNDLNDTLRITSQGSGRRATLFSRI